MKSAVLIRRAHHDDVAALLELESLFPSDRMSAATVRRFLRVPTAVVWVAEISGQILGSLVLLSRRNTGVARIYSVVVAPSERGQGLAQQLVQVAENHARKNKVAISLEVRHDNIAARALYRKLDYAEAKRLPHYYDDGVDGLRLRKALKKA